LVVSGQVAFWHIYVINFLNATIAAFDAPGRQSLFPTLVPRGQLQNAITLNSMLFRSSNLVGPAVAGILIARVGVASPFFVNAVSYFAIIAGLLAMRIPAVAPRMRGSIRGGPVVVLRFADATWGTMRNAIAQLAAQDAYRGRVMSLIVIVSRGLTNASQLQTGVATALVGAPGAATIGAVVVGAVVVAVSARAERLRHFTAAAPRGGQLAEAAQAGGESCARQRKQHPERRKPR